MRTYDAIIAGGGVIGGAIALELARNDLRVALFDAREPGREASWASAGILSPAPENPWNDFHGTNRQSEPCNVFGIRR
jgi:glycine oxidase